MRIGTFEGKINIQRPKLRFDIRSAIWVHRKDLQKEQGQKSKFPPKGQNGNFALKGMMGQVYVYFQGPN